VKTEIQYAVLYMASGFVSPAISEDAAYKTVDRLLNFGIPTEVMCRRITYGAWVRPKVKLLSRG
jgi:hypothetical protein